MKLNDTIHGFTVKGVEHLNEIGCDVYTLEYTKNGARLVFFDRDDDNKTFSIAFKTLPNDSTGVFHILEHSVLCGSEKYPLNAPRSNAACSEEYEVNILPKNPFDNEL